MAPMSMATRRAVVLRLAAAPAAAFRFDCPIWTDDEDLLGSGMATCATSIVEIFLRAE